VKLSAALEFVRIKKKGRCCPVVFHGLETRFA